MKKLLLALWIALFTAPISHAADAAHLELIGFSKNGAYVAFDQFGILDGMKYPYIITSFVGVKNNRLEAEIKTVLDVDGATMAQARAKSKTQVAAAMKKYGIVSGNHVRWRDTDEARPRSAGRRRAVRCSGALPLGRRAYRRG